MLSLPGLHSGCSWTIRASCKAQQAATAARQTFASAVLGLHGLLLTLFGFKLLPGCHPLVARCTEPHLPFLSFSLRFHSPLLCLLRLRIQDCCFVGSFVERAVVAPDLPMHNLMHRFACWVCGGGSLVKMKTSKREETHRSDAICTHERSSEDFPRNLSVFGRFMEANVVRILPLCLCSI